MGPALQIEVSRHRRIALRVFGAREGLGQVYPVHAASIAEIGRWSEQQPVHDPEHRGPAAVPEREGEPDADREAWLGAQAPEGVAGVLQYGLEKRCAPSVTALFLHPLRASAGQAGPTSGLGGGHSLALILLRLARDVKLELGLEFLIELGAPHQGAEAVAQVSPQFCQQTSSRLLRSGRARDRRRK